MPRTKKPTKALVPEVIHDGPGQPTKYKPEYAQRLEFHLAQGNSFETFINHVDERVSIATLYNWCDAHPEFLEARERGNAARLEMMEQNARNIAVGIVAPLPKDAPAGTKMTKGSPHMTMFLLYNLAPDKYRAPGRREDTEGAMKSIGGSPERDATPAISFNYNRLPEPKKEEKK